MGWSGKNGSQEDSPRGLYHTLMKMSNPTELFFGYFLQDEFDLLIHRPARRPSRLKALLARGILMAWRFPWWQRVYCLEISE